MTRDPIRGTLPWMEPTEQESLRPFRVAIVGGGAAGAFVATQLLRAGRAGN